MQRNRNDEVRVVISHESAHPFNGQERQRITQLRVLMVFEGMDQIAYRPFIEKVCPGSVKMGRMGQARAAVVVTASPCKGDSAEGTER